VAMLLDDPVIKYLWLSY